MDDDDLGLGKAKALIYACRQLDVEIGCRKRIMKRKGPVQRASV